MTVKKQPAGLQTFEESLEFGVPFAEATVVGNVIQNVKMLGAVSKNGRVYSGRALTDAAKLYDGVRIMVDHPTDSDMMDRGGVREFDVLIGMARNPRVVGDSVRGDVVLLEGEPRTPKVLSLARDMPSLAGFSHRARGTITVDAEGIQHVESLEQVFALELVTQPATSNGLFESEVTTPVEEPKMEIKDLTLAQLKTSRPELVESIVAEVRESLKTDETQKAMEAKISSLETSLKESQTRADTLEAENKLRAHREMVAAKLAEAKLHPSVVTEQFRKDLDKAPDEATVAAMVEDRKALAEKIEGGLIEAADGAAGPVSDARNVDESLKAPPAKKGEKKPVTSEVVAEAVGKLF